MAVGLLPLGEVYAQLRCRDAQGPGQLFQGLRPRTSARQVLRMLDEFTRERGLAPQERLEIRSWLASLPWIGGWQDALPPSNGRDQEDDYYPVVDNDDGRDGGIIELHFSW